jgi:hypothetical protein
MPVQKRRRNPRRNKGKIKNVTPLTIDGIDFKSKLEGYCYEQLKANGIPFRYEQDSFILVDAFSFSNDSWELGKIKGERAFKKANPTIRAITYKPDFTNLDQGWVIECKGMMTDTFPIRWKLFKKYIVDNNYKYDLYMPRNKKHIDEVVKLIKEKYGSNKTRRK